MPLEFDDLPASDKTAALVESYRQNRDEMRASIKALMAIHGTELVCVAMHMANLKSIAIAANMSDELKKGFVGQAHALVVHYASASGADIKKIRTIAEGIWEQMHLMKTSLEEAGLPSNVPMPGMEDGD